MKRLNTMRLLLGFVALAMLAACASMGRPEGGPRDETPPVFQGSTPAPGSLNVSGSRVTLTFDENVQLDDPSNKIVISPAQSQAPSISSGGRRVTVELRDSMLPNTTYTIDFADAVKDLNEGNILDGLAIDFSTGSSLDTLRISGMVLEARTLEPAQGMLVGIYSTAADSAISTLKFERIAKTNQYGQFTVRNLKPGEYQIFALNDINRDLHWDRSEDVAFYDTFIVPSSEPIEVPDTLVAVDGTDSIVVRPDTRYMPDDVLLTWFNE
ncbi:MAG: Ig-like domain-containing protein, partial [Muribaculaceae bacterium]|nr:Ig-like domain-containing protein [Muribaculaceae bacterium]